jgi:hypothetical protein
VGTAPPVDAPSLPDQSALSASAGFDPGLPAADLCGFVVPFFSFALGFDPPPISFPPPIPTFGPSLGLNCSTTNPISVSAKLPYGGGRVGTGDPDPDLQFDQ